MIVCVPEPTALGVYVTFVAQTLDDEVEGVSVQEPLLLKLPLPLDVKLTVPLGDDLVPLAVSVTVAVQMVLPP